MQHFNLKLHLISRKTVDGPELVRLCKENDTRAQKALYDFLAPKMFPLCIRYMGDRETAQDILQEGFVTLFSKLDSYSGEGSFEGWARRIFVNTALMSLRKSDVLKGSEDMDAAYNISADSVSAVQQIGYKELMKLVGELPAGYRTVFNMYVVEGYSHKEISEALGISENTSRSQLQRARVMLQNRIIEEERKDV